MIQRLDHLSLAQFRRLSHALADKHGREALVIGLIGPLGAGKTTFVKNFAGRLGVKKIKSPTFTVVNTFGLPKRTFYHIDLYRLNSYSELGPLGVLPAIKETKDLIIIEWVDKFPKLKKYCGLIIKISFSKEQGKRNVTIQQN